MTVMNPLCSSLEGVMLANQGNFTGLELIQTALNELREARFHMHFPAYLAALAHGLSANGQMTEASITIQEALEWSEDSEERWCMPELLRIKGALSRFEQSAAAAEDHYMQALGWARQQQAFSWGTACRYEPRPAVAPARPGRRSGRAPFFSLQSSARASRPPISGRHAG